MTAQPKYLRYLEEAQQAETAESLQAQGYSVQNDVQVGDIVFDLVARKEGRQLAYEFKAGRSARTGRESLMRLQNAAKAEGLELRIVVVTPPARVHVEVDSLRDALLQYMVNESFPDELETLSTHTRIEGLSDLEITDLRVTGQEMRVSGSGSVDVALQYGSASDNDSEHGSKLLDSYPFRFKATLGLGSELIAVHDLSVDTSSFYE